NSSAEVTGSSRSTREGFPIRLPSAGRNERFRLARSNWITGILLGWLALAPMVRADSSQLDKLAANRQTNPKQKDRKTGEPVTASTGCFEQEETDLSVSARGLAFAFTRTYRNGSQVESALGKCWDFNWNKYIELPLRFTPLEPPWQGPGKVPTEPEPVEGGGTQQAVQLPWHFQYGYWQLQEGAFYYD